MRIFCPGEILSASLITSRFASKDAIVFVRIAVELLGDLGQIVARLNDVVFNFLLTLPDLALGQRQPRQLPAMECYSGERKGE